MRYGLCLLLTLCGCGTSLNYVATADPPRPLFVRSADQVEIFMTRAPDRPAIEIGMIESQQEEMSSDDSKEVIGKMRIFAGKRGCDALVIFAGNDATVGQGGPTYASVKTLKGYRGSCVVYTGPSTGQLPAATAIAPAAAPAAAPTAVTEPPAAAPTGSSCMPNSTQLCYGAGGCRGGQSCTADGRGYTVCDCGNAAARP